MDSLERKIPPVAVFCLSAAAMWAVSAMTPGLRLNFPWQIPVAVALVGLGLVTGLAGVLAFRRKATTVSPLESGDPAMLVTIGIYRYTRNPMYLGLLLGLCGIAILLGSIVGLIVPPAFVVYINRFQIDPEERDLEGVFPEAFESYRSGVRRWI